MIKFTTLSIFIIYIFSSGNLISQTFSNSNIDEPQSIVIQPQGLNISPSGAFSTPVTVNGFDNFNLGVDFGEPHIATNPRDPFNSICAFNINNFYYTLDGFDWKKISVSFFGFNVIGDPVMAYDSLGNAYYVQLYQNGNTYGVCIAKSTNKGVTWAASYGVYSTTVGLSDKEWVTADQTAGPYSNNLYIGWRQFGSTGMRVVKSSNGGVNWSAPQTYTGGQGAYLAVGSNGNIQGGSVYFASLNGGTILVNRSTDGGQTFSAQVPAINFIPGGTQCAGRYTVKTCIRMDGMPRMSADNSYTSTRGNVYVAYCMNPGTQDKADINLVRSTDFGVTWSTPVRVNDDATTTDQWLPAISVDNKTGKIFMSWFDSREDPTGNILTKIYGTVSTNGGASFTANGAISNALFNPDNMRVGQPGGESYIGDYMGVSAIGNTSYSVSIDARNNNLGSYTAYYPDFAMTINNTVLNLGNNDSGKVVIKIPAVNGPFSQRVRFTPVLDSIPASGNISFSFQNGKDSISAFPDSVTLIIRTVGAVTPGGYNVNINGKGTQGPPIHIRKTLVLVNSSLVTVGTNRPGIAEFKVNGISYIQQQQLVFSNGSNVTFQAISPRTLGVNQYVFKNWSNGGDTTQTISVNSSITLTAFYKIQYKLLISSTQGNTFGGNVFYDSASSATFGVLSRIIVNGGTTYYFRGWAGTGTGSYTSADSSGIDSVITLQMGNPISQTARWTTTVGINQINSEVPQKFELYENYPNPFNPVTNIRFDVAKNEFVTLKVFNLLGKEIKTLVNENLSAGTYNVDFDASLFASGIYFYRIETQSFTETKRMMLVK